ncbi:uncharacterized protein LOC144098811 isoform X5 [Amblyomma americanum]
MAGHAHVDTMTSGRLAAAAPKPAPEETSRRTWLSCVPRRPNMYFLARTPPATQREGERIRRGRHSTMVSCAQAGLQLGNNRRHCDGPQVDVNVSDQRRWCEVLHGDDPESVEAWCHAQLASERAVDHVTRQL